MRIKGFAVLFAAVVAVQLSAVQADASTIVMATGSGWCNDDDGCNNTDINVISNHFATPDEFGVSYRDWFAFDLTGVGAITSATLNIWSDSSNTFDLPYDPAGQFDVYTPAGFSFAGLLNGPSLATIGAAAAHPLASEYVSITFNALGLAALNDALGGGILFSGVATGVNGQYFGYTGGSPVAFLELNAEVGEPAPVPEPASMLMLGAGLAGIGAAVRRRKRS